MNKLQDNYADCEKSDSHPQKCIHTIGFHLIKFLEKCKLIYSDGKQINGCITKGHKNTLGDDDNVCYLIIAMASRMSKFLELEGGQLAQMVRAWG